MKKLLPLLVTMVLLVILSSPCVSAANEEITIDSAYYDIHRGIVFEGSVSNSSAEIVTIHLNDGQTDYSSIANICSGRFSGEIDVPILTKGVYDVQVSLPSGVIVTKVIAVDGIISITDAVFNAETMKITVVGTTNLGVVDLRLVTQKTTGKVTTIEPSNGQFRCNLEVGDFNNLPTVLSATSGRYHDEMQIDYGHFIKLDKVAYDDSIGQLSWSGLSTEEQLLFELSSTDEGVIFSQLSSVSNGVCEGVQSFQMTPGVYTAKLQSVYNNSLYDNYILRVSSYQLTTDSPLELSVLEGVQITAQINLDGAEYSDLNVKVSNKLVASAFLSDGGLLTITSFALGETDILISIGNSALEFHLVVTPDDSPPELHNYKFTLRMDYDSESADYGMSNYLPSDLRQGITLEAEGFNAGEALEKALNDVNIPCDFWSKEDGTIKYWIDDILGLGDEKLDGGLWKYWIQYQVVNGEQSYNQWSLGFYTHGGEFYLVYGITEESGQIVHPGDVVPEIPDEYNGIDSQTTVEVRENEDGSTTVIADSTSVIDGTQTVAEITTKENEDGSTTVTENTTVTNPDGTSSTTSSVTTVAADGTKTTESTVTNPDGTSSTTSSVTTVAADGTKTTQSTVTNSDGSTSTITSTVSADGTTTTATETSKDASGSIVQTVEATTSVTDTTVNGVRTTETVKESTVTDASGNTTVVNVTETAVKQADGSSTVVRTTETVKDGKTVTETAAGSISADGRVHTTVTSADGEIVTSIRADGEDGSYSVSDASVQTALQQQSAISDAVGEDKEKVIEITSDARDVSASIGQQALESMADDGASLRMVSVQGSMTFGKDAIANLSGKDDVTLSFAIADRSSMTSAQREVIEAGSTVVSLTATSAGQSIGSDLGGKVVVTVKHVAVDGKTPVAYYVDGDGNRTRVVEQHYDAEKEEMTMVLDHFSIYTIVDESPAGEELPVAVLVMTAVIVLICLGILLPQVVGRKQ